ncbi:MAG: MBL fold metallo-hydrolase [Pseudomonadales bacterium]
MKPEVKAFFDEPTNTVSYVVSDPTSAVCAVIDSVWDYDHAAGRTSTESADAIITYICANDLQLDWILETHVHADHLSAAPYIKQQLGGQIAIGAEVKTVQNVFGTLFNAEPAFTRDGSQFDHLLDDNETFALGGLQVRALHTPGHTPACMTYIIGDCAFVGDTLFMPDYGTARADFPGGDAATLYRSIQLIFTLPDNTRLFMCHDYKAPGRDEYRWETTVAEQKANNVHVHDGTSEAEFAIFRKKRDATLGMPHLILPSVQVNMRAGHLPPAEVNGTRYLKIPLDVI